MQAIYIIEYNKNIYVGETNNVERRFRLHKVEQRRAYKLLGINERPIMKVLVELPDNTTKRERLRLEKEWIEHFKSFRNIVNVPRSEYANPPRGPRPEMSGELNPSYKGQLIRLKNIKTGEILEMKGVKATAKAIGAHHSNLISLLKGKGKSCKGWKVESSKVL